MKPLNRPMFRYGGPIKEGVMSGIREPKKNGGSMLANDEGPRRAALVGNPIYPKGPDGRTNHVLPLIIGQGLRMAARPFGKFVMRQMAGPVKKNLPIKNLNLNLKGTPIKGGLQAERFDPNFIGKAFINDPLAKSVMTGSSFVGRGIKAGGKGIYNVGKYATTTPSGLAFLGLPVTVSAGRYFLSDGKEIKGNDINKITQGRVGTSGAPGGGDPGMYLTPQGDASKKGGGVELTAEQLRKKNVERYRDIMDIKGMNKDAAYNSLIAASQAINESGDFKGDIKSGKLINQIIQATSKQFDKPKATKDAIDTLILKGEIEKDINASDPKSIADLAYKEAATKKLNKELKGNTTAEIIQARMLKDEMPTGSNLAGLISINNPELNIKVLPTKDLGNADPIDYMTEIVTTVNADETTPDYPAGVYVLKDKVIQITEEGSVIPVPINALK